MISEREFSTDIPKVARSLAWLLLVLAGVPLTIAWLFGYYLSAAIVGISTVYFMYPHLSKFVRLIFTRRALILGEEGLFDRTFALGFIPWSEIEGAKLTESQSHKIVELKLCDEETFRKEFLQRTWMYRYPQRKSFESGEVGFWIDTHWIDDSPDHVLQAIRSRVKTTA